MKHLKMFGLSGLAALVVLAVIGPASASATALYNGSNVKLGVGSKKSMSLVAGTSAVLTLTDGTVLVTCAISEGEGEVGNAGGASATVSLKYTKLHFTSCTEPVVTVTLGTIEIHQIGSGTNGTVIAKQFIVRVNTTVFGAVCEYTTGEALDLGELKGATGTGTATIAVNAVVPAKNSFFCPDARWEATYTVTTPIGLHVEAS
jgi:hypothetical protein